MGLAVVGGAGVLNTNTAESGEDVDILSSGKDNKIAAVGDDDIWPLPSGADTKIAGKICEYS